MRRTVLTGLGLLLIALGTYVAARPLVGLGRPVTASRWLDIAFAAFFVIRGVMNVRTARRPLRRPSPPPSET